MTINLKTVGIVVADMGKTLSFYRAIGLSIPDNLDHESNVDYEAPNCTILGFLSEEVTKHADPNYKKPVGESLNLQFLVDTPEDVDKVYHNLLNAGYEGYAEPWDSFWGQRYGRVKDPDGRLVNIYAHL